MSIAAHGHGDVERIARRALDRVRTAAERSQGESLLALAVAGESAPIEIPAELSEVVMTALENLAAGHQVTVLSRDAELTTVQAAEVLNVSRPHLIKLLDAGVIGYRMVGTHRRVHAGSLFQFKTRDDARAHGAADALTTLSEEMGIDR
jgi:excisionase family DNA binding protein